MTNVTLKGKSDEGNPFVQFEEVEVVAAATPRREFLIYKE